MAKILGGKHKIFKNIEKILEDHGVVFYYAVADTSDIITKPATDFETNAVVHVHDIRGNEYVFKILNIDEDNTLEKYASIHGTMEMGYFFKYATNTYALLLDGEDLTLKINGEVVVGAYIEIEEEGDNNE